LVAYVESCDINEEQLRNYCRSHLASFMVPSMYIVLEQLPVNPNGKLDRNRLPMPDISLWVTMKEGGLDVPRTSMEERVHALWCQVLRRNDGQISTTASFFSVGGHSLLLMQLYHLYQSLFGFDTHILSITPFLRQTTIGEHANLLQTIKSFDIDSKAWQPLYINKGSTFCKRNV
jgi:hypothetical protein